MFDDNHAATALLLKGRYPRVRMAWLLVSVQLVELLWVVFNLTGIERTTTEAAVHSLADIHLVHMPFSHSVTATVLLAGGAWAILRFLLGRKVLAAAAGLGIASHLVLDLATHAPDIPLLLTGGGPLLGSGLYSAAPAAALLIECAYGLTCWYLYRGSRGLLAVILGFNLSNASLYLSGIHGPETLLAGRADLIVGLIAAQIIVTLFLVGMLSRRQETGEGGTADRPLVAAAPTR